MSLLQAGRMEIMSAQLRGANYSAQLPTPCLLPRGPSVRRCCRTTCTVVGKSLGYTEDRGSTDAARMNKRTLLTFTASSVCSFLSASAERAEAVQGLTAGRVPGTSPSDVEGFNAYTRPSGKSGGHGIGWSEIQPYSFLVPENWIEVPTSIADLGGSEVDLRFSDKAGGDLAVVVAPVLRFADVGFNADVTIEELGTPKKIISAFAPEITGSPLEEDGLVDIGTFTDDAGLKYFQYELKSPHTLICATAVKNRLFIMTVRGSSSAWRKSQKALRLVRDSFRVESTS